MQKAQTLLGSAGVLVIPLKLSFAYGALLPFLALWLIQNFKALASKLSSSASPLTWPLLVFAIVGSISGLLGFDSWRSLRGLLGLAFLLTLVPALGETGERTGFLKLLLLLIAGQTIAAFDSVLQGGLGTKNLFIGKVSESGQLAMTWLLAFGVILELRRKVRSEIRSYRLASFAAANFLLFALLGFADYFAVGWGIRYMLLFLVAALLIQGALAFFRSTSASANERCKAYLSLLALYALPLLSAALLINLKRGPWAGVLLGALLLLAYNSRKLAGGVVALSLLLAVAVAPIRSRIQEAPADFFSEGGRATIWAIAYDLAARYPLGIGFNNSPFLRNYSAHIPPDNTHFHNNLLNVLVETGALGLLIFVWWVYVLLREALRKYRRARAAGDGIGSTMPLVLGAAILSWQSAGMVEYNFGDAEVFFVALLVVAFLNNAEKLQQELKAF